MQAEQNELELYKRNIVRFAKLHRKTFSGDCNVSLFLVMKLAQKAGVKFSNEEKSIFM